MKSAPVQNTSSLASLPREKRRARSPFSSLFIILMGLIFIPLTFCAQTDTSKLTVTEKISAPPNDTIIKPGSSGIVKTNSPFSYLNYLTPEQKRKRQWIVGGLNVIGYGASLIIFNNTWYKDYPKTSFHTFNDNGEWLQMDKVGHAWASYNAGRASAAMWVWAGVAPKKAAWIGGLSSTVYMTVIEILDAHSAQWGWSWGDMAANLFGSGLFISQQVGWEEQRIQFKFSFHRKTYSDSMLNERSDNLFGSGWAERMLKDYNGQTYWLSANLRSFFPGSNIPPWLNVAIGYGADGMFGGYHNVWIDEETGLPVNRTDIKRYRQWFLAPDVNFSKIKTNSKGMKLLFGILDAFKFPTPSLELSNGKLKVNAIHF
jgi:Predicted periplasmic lipoprotein (DUF2279)